MSSNLHKLKSAIKSIERAEEYVENMTYDQFSSDHRTSDAVLIHLINLGERLNGLTSDFKEFYKELPYDEARATRNYVTHQYDGVDQALVWNTLRKEFPKIKVQLQKIIKELT